MPDVAPAITTTLPFMTSFMVPRNNFAGSLGIYSKS